ncbi:MAG: hypothetical protein WC624_02895, partial [Candidatus Margulisiibacteriota bacterium]
LTLNKGDVGIGTTDPAAKLDVYAIPGGSPNVGIKGYGDLYGVWGASDNYAGVYATGKNYGIYASGIDGPGVYAQSQNDIGVVGLGKGAGMPSLKYGYKYGGLFASTDGTGGRALGVVGNIWATGTLLTSQGLDVAEWFKVDDESISAGDVVEIDNNSVVKIRKSRDPYSTLAAGIISTDPSVLAGNLKEKDELLDRKDIENKGYRMLALAGRVPCNVSTENGPINVGNLLTTSSTPGYAMKVTDRMKAMGAVIGKALEPLKEGKGKIMVLVTLQ